jgi:hypothetical protein
MKRWLFSVRGKSKTERSSRDGASRSHIAVSSSLFTQGKKKKKNGRQGGC